MGLEQADTLDTETTGEPVQVAIDQDREITSILGNALKESQETPKVQPGTGESPKTGQVQQEQVETPFLELVVGGNKVPLKSEEDWIQFLESNPTLKEGWLKNADYTRKTMALADDRKVFDQQLKEFKTDQESWGKVKPDTNSMNAFKTIWNVYQGSEPIVQDAIQKFVQDITMIGNGQMPVGPIAQMLGIQGSSTGQISPQLLPLQQEMARQRQEFQQFRAQTEAEKKQALEQYEVQQRQQAEQTVDKWVKDKTASGVQLSEDEFNAMAEFMKDGIVNPRTQQPFTLDEAYNLSLTLLGKQKAAIAKEVIKDAKLQNAKTPNMPSSRVSSTHEPEPKDIKEILQWGAKQLQPA